MAVTAEDIIGFLDEELGVEMEDIDADSLLFSTALIDSFSLVDLLAFLEEKAGFQINPADVNLKNLDSVNRMLAYLAKQA